MAGQQHSKSIRPPRRNEEIRHEASRFLVESDCLFFSQLALSNRLDSIRPHAMLALVPFISMFVIESSSWLQAQVIGPYRKHGQTVDPILARSRQRVKLLDDNRHSFKDILKTTSRLSAINSRWFYEPNRGILGPLKRRLQQDLGVFFLDGEVINTTHAAFLNLGLNEEDLGARSINLESLGPFVLQMGVDFGQHLGQLIGKLELQELAGNDTSSTPIVTVQFRDVKSAAFYTEISNRIAPGFQSIVPVLMSILSLINSARVLVPALSESHNVTVFKLRFVALYQSITNLQLILRRAEDGEVLLASPAMTILKELLSSLSSQVIRERKELRNTLVHYGLKKRVAASLSREMPYMGIFEACADGMSLEEVEDIVESSLTVISDGLRNLLVPGLSAQGAL